MKRRKTIEEVFQLYDALYRKPDYDYIHKKSDAIWTSFEDNLNIQRPADFEDIVQNHMRYYFDLFGRLASYYPIKDSFHLGCYYIDNFNAESSFIDEHKIILIDANLLTFYMEIILSLYYLTYEDYLSKEEKVQCEYFINYSFHKFYHQGQKKDNRFLDYEHFFDVLAPKNHTFLFEATVAQNTILYFIMAHELGHFYHHHASVKREITRGRSSISHQNELQADVFGYEMVIKLCQEIRAADNTNSSPHFDRMPLLMFDVLDLYYAKFGHKENYHSHPRPALRKEQLIDAMRQDLSKEGERIYYDLLETLQEVEIYGL